VNEGIYIYEFKSHTIFHTPLFDTNTFNIGMIMVNNK